MKYTFIDKDNRSKTVFINDEYLANRAKQALEDYEISKQYIMSQCYYLWRYGEKRYRLDTQDRAVAKKLKKWQSNITGGLSRTFIDTFTSSLDTPIVPMATAVGDTDSSIAVNVTNSLISSADISNSHVQGKIILREGLKTGQLSMRVGYRKTSKKHEYYTEDSEGNLIPHTIERNKVSVPTLSHVPVWELFPDPYSSAARYVCHRFVTTYSKLMLDYGYIINHIENKSPFSREEFLSVLSINSNGADLSDYGNVVNEILTAKNSNAMALDSYLNNNNNRNTINSAQNTTQDNDASVTANLIEVIIATYDDYIVMHANGYPIYIGNNFFGFNNYIVQSATDITRTLGVEGIPYLLSGIEEIYDGFINHLIDSAKITTTPNFLGVKGVFEDESQVSEMSPGDVLWIETPPVNGVRALERIDKGSVTDNGITEMMQSLATQKTGVSEYNLGIAARERTATGASAVANSDKKRLIPYIENFVICLSRAMEMWLSLQIDNWTSKQWVNVVGVDGVKTRQQLSNADIAGDVVISMDIDGLLAKQNDINVKRLIEFFPQIVNSGMTDRPGEVLAEIFKGLGLKPEKFKINYEKKMPDTPLGSAKTLDETEQITPEEVVDTSTELQEAVNPQLNLQE